MIYQIKVKTHRIGYTSTLVGYDSFDYLSPRWWWRPTFAQALNRAQRCAIRRYMSETKQEEIVIYDPHKAPL